MLARSYDLALRTTLYLGEPFPLEGSIHFRMFIQLVSCHSQVQLLAKLSIFNIYIPGDYSASALEIVVPHLGHQSGTFPGQEAKRVSGN